MTRVERYAAIFVDAFPTPLEPGVLYVSTSYSTAGHLCPCGCNREVVTKLSPARWRVIYDGEVSLKPSIASTALPCNSHYFITRGKVDWRDQLTADRAARVQVADRRATELLRTRESAGPRGASWWKRLMRRAV